jgi:hypothetical protein
MKFFVINNNGFTSVITAKNTDEAWENNIDENSGENTIILTEKEAKKMARAIIAWKV